LNEIHNLELRGLVQLVHNIAYIFLFRWPVDCCHKEDCKKLDIGVSDVGFELRQMRLCWSVSRYLYRFLYIVMFRHSIKIDCSFECKVVQS